MAHLSNLIRIGALGLLATAGLSAQDWSYGFKLSGGPLSGSAKTFLGDSGYTYGAAFEGYRTIDKSSGVVVGLGFQFFPGDYKVMSYLPATLPVRALAGTYYERAQVDKADAQGIHATALYRRDFYMEGMYLQGGLRFQWNKMKTVSTGTLATVTVVTNATAGSITRYDAIANTATSRNLTAGLQAGLGYRLNDSYALELNLWSTRLEGPGGVTKGGIASEFSFGFRF